MSLGELGRDHLEHDREHAGILEQLRVLDEPLALCVGAALDLEAAERVDRLGVSPRCPSRGSRLRR
jgi:hypothetical protein